MLVFCILIFCVETSCNTLSKMPNFYENLTGSHESETWSWWCAVFAAVLAISWYSWLMVKKSSKGVLSLPPGPRGLPLLGNLLSIEPQLHYYLTRLSQTYGPIFKLKLGSKLCIVVSSSDLARVVLKEQDAIFANRDVTVAAKAFSYGGIDIVWSPNGPHWRKLRKIFVREMMSHASLSACYALRRQEVREMVKNLHGKVGSPINIGELVFITTLNLITSLIWGRPILHGEDTSSTGPEFRLMVDEIIELVGKPNISDLFPALARFDLQGIESKMKKFLLRFDKIFDSVIAGRMNPDGKAESNDLLQFLLELKHQGNDESMCLSLEEIKALFVDIILAATDTTSTTVEWAMAEILQHPDKMSRSCQELDAVVGNQDIVDESHSSKLIYLDALIKETLRLHPPVPLLVPHSPSTTCCVAGYTIPEGSRILLNVWAMQRDSSVWENAEEFEPERFLKEPGKGEFHGNYFSYLPFGSGRRMCAGIPIAEKMVKYMLATLLHSFDWNVSDGMELDMSEKFGISLKKTTPLVATPSVRLTSVEQYL